MLNSKSSFQENLRFGWLKQSFRKKNFNFFFQNKIIILIYNYFKPSHISREELKLPRFQHVIAHLIADNMIANRLSGDGWDWINFFIHELT